MGNKEWAKNKKTWDPDLLEGGALKALQDLVEEDGKVKGIEIGDLRNSLQALTLTLNRDPRLAEQPLGSCCVL